RRRDGDGQGGGGEEGGQRPEAEGVHGPAPWCGGGERTTPGAGPPAFTAPSPGARRAGLDTPLCPGVSSTPCGPRTLPPPPSPGAPHVLAVRAAAHPAVQRLPRGRLRPEHGCAAAAVRGGAVAGAAHARALAEPPAAGAAAPAPVPHLGHGAA